MQISIGGDHAGYPLKEALKKYLLEHEIDVVDRGTCDEKSVDYPDFGFQVAEDVSRGKSYAGVLVCGTGIGMSICANKVRGVYAALCHDVETARLSRRHNGANVLVLGGRVTNPEEALAILDEWLKAPIEEDRHERRRKKIKDYEALHQNDIEEVGPRTVVLKHPLIRDKVARIRDENTSVKDFREYVGEISGLMVYEAMRNLPVTEVFIQTPLARTRGISIAASEVILIPILRAGLGMVDTVLRFVPDAKVGHVGLYRDHETLKPVEYYSKLPDDIGEHTVFVLDPMLATGGSAVAAIDLAKQEGAKPGKIFLISIVSAPEGVAKVREHHPDVFIYTAALDDHLDAHGYIVPGLGDAGDRLFGTL